MNNSVAEAREMSPRRKGVLLASLFLLTIVTGIIAQIGIGDRFINLNDAARTFQSIAGNRSMYRLGFTLYMVEMLSQIVWVLLLYDLLKPVNRTVARTAAIVGLTGCGIKIVARLFYYAPLFMTTGTAFSGLAPEQLQALTLLVLKLNDTCAAIAMVLFGFESMLEGWLVIKSTFLPKFLGVFAIFGGLGLMTFAWPPLGHRLFMLTAPIALVGSLLMIGWLLVKGVDEARWFERARNSAASVWR